MAAVPPLSPRAPFSRRQPPRTPLPDNPNAGADPIGDEMFRLLVENVHDYAIFMLDPQGIVSSWNAGARHIKGYTKNEIIGRHFSVFYTPDAIARHWPHHELTVAREEGRFEDEGWRLRKDGTAFWANVVITPVYDDRRRLRGFAKITRDLTARRKMEEMQLMERRMNEFLAMLAHELRNPLSPIQSALDVAERKPDDPTIRRWAHDIIQRQTRQLSRLVNDLLDVSRVTRGQLPLRREPIDVRATIAHVVDALQPTIRARKQTVKVNVPDAPLVVDADPARLAQIFSNIVGNAVKYTHEGGTITIHAAPTEGLASISVADDGVGMSADLVPRVFDLFVQGERALDRHEGGLGVGLTVAKRLVDLHGGTMSAASAGPGLGSRFTIELPLLDADRVPLDEASAPASASPSRPRRVLVVDDNEDAAEALATLLGLLGHEATVLHDGHQALRDAPARRPDVMLLDIGLPGIDGFEVARRVRKMPELDGVRLVACTGYGQVDDLRRMREAGFDRHVVKPVDAAELERVLSD